MRKVDGVGARLLMLAVAAGCGAESAREDPNGTGGLTNLSLDGGASSSTGDAAPGGDDDTGGEAGGSGAGSDDDAIDLDTKWDVHPADTDGGPPNNGCISDPLDDMDGDGFTEADGDCNDCDANVNPGAIEVEITEPDMMGNVPEPADEDCDGLIDNVDPPCDGAFAVDDSNPFNAAAAMDLCKVAVGPSDWGVVSASWVRANGRGSPPELIGRIGAWV